VFGSHSEYVKLIKRLLAVGMVSLTTHPKVINGVFAVPKDAEEDRLIIDAVFANAWFATPAKVQLPDPSHLAKVQCDPKHGPIYVAKSDLSNFYHYLAIPAWMRPYFCLVGVPASDLGLTGSHLVYPMCHTTPMGWSHAVYVAQSAHEHTLYSAGVLRREDSLLVSHVLDSPSVVKHGLYIDDGGHIGHDQQRVQAQLDLCCDAYERRGFVVKRSKVVRASADGVRLLGLLVDGQDRSVSVPVESRVDLLRSTLTLLAKPKVSGLDLAALVGRFTWCMLVRRPALQCFHQVYRFIQVRKAQRGQVWPTVVRELLLACALLPLLSASLTLPFSSRLLATDASDLGGAVVSRTAAASESSVLRSPSFMVSSMLTQSWSTIIQHRWRYKEHINALELRAILLGLIWMLTCKQISHRVLLFTDSTVCLGVLTKGRTSAKCLRLIHNTVAAVCLSSGVSLVPTYVPSDLNPADGPSRFKPTGPRPEPAPPHTL
jgi:hypothetical protein